MVNEFSGYARAPELEFHLLDLNALVREVLALYEASGAERSGVPQPHGHLVLAADLPTVPEEIPRVCGKCHNLLRVRRIRSQGRRIAITVRTEIVPKGLRLVGNGGGFPEQVKARVFEPYVTPKSKGLVWVCPS